MQSKQYRAAAFDDRVQRPRVAPSVEVWRDLNVVEGSGDVRDDPEDEE